MSPLPTGPPVLFLLLAHPLDGATYVANSGGGNTSASVCVCVCVCVCARVRVCAHACILCVSGVCNADTYTNHHAVTIIEHQTHPICPI